MDMTLPPEPRSRTSSFSGWRRTATCLTILISMVTGLLVTALIMSLRVINGGGSSLFGETVFYYGRCERASRINLWIHLAINVIGTGILGSSNFFMQVLVAPTRREVDQAHTSGHWVEIGVHSIRNFRFISRHRIFLWILFSLSSIPLHLVFNGCVLESKATNGFLVVMASESFLDGAPFTVPGVSESSSPEYFDPKSLKTTNDTINSIYQSVSQMYTDDWEQLAFQDCMRRYNNPDISMIHYRHVIMIMSNQNNTSSSGWTRNNVNDRLEDTGWADGNSANSLWFADSFQRTGSGRYFSNGDFTGNKAITDHGHNGLHSLRHIKLDPVTGIITMHPGLYKPAFHTMKVDYCLSERFHAPCRLSIANSLLFIVCIMCSVKCLLCVSTLLISARRAEDPLMTIGDAIASLITNPDGGTKEMCTLSSQDLATNNTIHSQNVMRVSYTGLEGPRSWKTIPRRSAGRAVPKSIWVLSYLLIGSSLIVAGVFFILAIRERPLGESRFAHDPRNVGLTESSLQSMSVIGLTMISNIPQLLLSICYMVYNGLLTRMLTEFEWARYSVAFQTLRVTHPRGQQRSTYRLQLPYRWSIPILLISSILHWVYSNCFYISNYEDYDSELPYGIRELDRGLQFSTVAILVGFVLSVSTALSPIILASFRLPGKMVLGGSNSKVISAACHCIPIRSTNATHESARVTIEPLQRNNTGCDILDIMATRRLRWGEVSTGNLESQVGHLAFGMVQQRVTEPIDGKRYSGCG